MYMHGEATGSSCWVNVYMYMYMYIFISFAVVNYVSRYVLVL